MDNPVFLIGIAGGTGSGKTSLAKAISTDFGFSEVAVIQQDSYYFDLSNLSMKERIVVNSISNIKNSKNDNIHQSGPL